MTDRSETRPTLPRYDPSRTYDWNYHHAPDAPPDPGAALLTPLRGTWDFCGIPVDSPLGIAAGPLLNGRWVLYYASLGFDVLTYKTVRSVARASYDLPNLQPVRTESPVVLPDETLAADERMRGTWAVSFGMPSREPDVWRADVEATRAALPREKVLSVSVVATPQPLWTLDELADDYARCARWATESGADCVEANFSCPNVASCDGDLYQRPGDAALVAARLRDAVGRIPLLIKVGQVTDAALAEKLLESLAPHADAVATVNTVRARVAAPHGEPMFGGQPRGIAGDAIRDASLAQVNLLARIVRERSLPTRLVGIGGIATASHARQFLDAGCHAVHLATAAMLEPDVALRIRRDWR